MLKLSEIELAKKKSSVVVYSEIRNKTVKTTTLLPLLLEAIALIHLGSPEVKMCIEYTGNCNQYLQGKMPNEYKKNAIKEEIIATNITKNFDITVIYTSISRPNFEIIIKPKEKE